MNRIRGYRRIVLLLSILIGTGAFFIGMIIEPLVVVEHIHHRVDFERLAEDFWYELVTSRIVPVEKEIELEEDELPSLPPNVEFVELPPGYDYVTLAYEITVEDTTTLADWFHDNASYTTYGRTYQTLPWIPSSLLFAALGFGVPWLIFGLVLFIIKGFKLSETNK